uniref:Uncharacterized protein n=1 Tax=Timema monikensis TaxID=170555 RepID=A0A7R9EBI8_9NEOP|nr:unnamed protein product [Timema monikensis]
MELSSFFGWLDTCSILAVGRLGRVAQSVRYFFGERRSAIVFCAMCRSSESGPLGLVVTHGGAIRTRTESLEHIQERQGGSGSSVSAGRAVENTYSFV